MAGLKLPTKSPSWRCRYGTPWRRAIFIRTGDVVDQEVNVDIRKEYQALVEKQLNEWKVYADKLKKHSADLEVQARRQFDQQLENIRTKQAEVSEHFAKLKEASEQTWAQWKGQLDKAWEEMRKASDRLTEQFRKK